MLIAAYNLVPSMDYLTSIFASHPCWLGRRGGSETDKRGVGVGKSRLSRDFLGSLKFQRSVFQIQIKKKK